jgi:hypothetical protein
MSGRRRSIRATRAGRARQSGLLGIASALVLWGCGGALQPGDGGMSGAAGSAGTSGAAGTSATGLIDGGFAGTAGAAGPDDSGPCLQPSDVAVLARFQTGVLGSWLGTATTPSGWTWSTATVEFTFFCDGHYHARCLSAEGLSPDSCVALYYGTDADSAEKTYDIYDVGVAAGTATANIDVVFDTSNSVTHDKLNAIALDDAADRLAFDLIHLNQYGPVHYDLQRAP